MDSELFLRFKALVREGKTVRAIRTELGEELDEFDDPTLIRKMLTIVGGKHVGDTSAAVSCS